MGVEASWRPAASLEVLRLRAALVNQARRFFAERGVMEVDTPVLSASAASDVHIGSLQTRVSLASAKAFFLQTSPESAMKRLLAAGSGSIFQFARAFRDAESGRLHNPEFLMLEWYRPGFDLSALMQEVAALVAQLLNSNTAATRLSYRDAFLKYAGIDPFTAGVEEIGDACRQLGFPGPLVDRNQGLDLLLARRVQPGLPPGCVFVYNYPADQAALARIRAGDPPVAERFELFVDGVELANGYQELTDAQEQRNRIEADLARRRKRGLPVVPKDRHLLDALEHGLPECAGVALGFDRLVGLEAGIEDIRRVMAFPIGRA